MNKIYLLPIFLWGLLSSPSWAGGVRGTVKDTQGQPLSYATIYVKQTGSGTTTNQEGRFEINLAPGSYELIFQYLGYQSVAKKVNIGQDFITLNIRLREQVINLEGVDVFANQEDPAYTIMRKAIAKTKFHLQQLDSYSARVYIKGSGRATRIPRLFRKRLQKEGIDVNTAFTTESVSQVKYQRPNHFEEKVISVKKQGEAFETDPNAFVQGSFYNPKVNGVISPLSPKAFAYYQFTLEGVFYDGDTEVNRIRVRPRTPGEGVFSGIINIVDDVWSIHSLDLITYKFGFKIDVRQIYEPIQDKVWLPISHTFDFSGKVFGFGVIYNYLVTISNYEIVLNPDLELEFVVIDETVERELAASIEKKQSGENQQLEERLQNGNELTRKELKQLLKEYEKEELKKQEEPLVVSNANFSIDSLAHKRDSIYWEEIRPVPLDTFEIRGYSVRDSLEKAELEEDPDGIELGAKATEKDKFGVGDLVFGNSYTLKKGKLKLDPAIANTNFNTVEGINLDYGLSYSINKAEQSRFEVAGLARYGFGRKVLNGKLRLAYEYGPRLRRSGFELAGGRYIFQYNSSNPIHPFINTLWTLLFEDNYMKIFEKEYFLARYHSKLRENLKLNVDLEWSRRIPLQNLSNESGWFFRNKDYSSNEPDALELGETAQTFFRHQAVILSLGLSWAPWQKYRIRNDVKYVIPNSSPEFTLSYKKGIPDFINSEVDYEKISFAFQHRFNIGVRGRFDTKVEFGTFLKDERMAFMDFQHFLGNQTFLVIADPVGSFRLMDYYLYSTKAAYINAHLHYQFRKLLVTQILPVRLFGIKENVFVNYLQTQTTNHYFELGYSIDHIFRFWRLELVSSFRDFQYEGFGVRIGLATGFN